MVADAHARESAGMLHSVPGVGGEPIMRVVVADGQGLVRAGLRVLLERESDVVEAASADEVVALAHSTAPDVVVVDLDLPGGGLEAVRRIDAPVVMLLPDDRELFAALRAGATGLLLKDGDASELRAAVRAAADGEAMLAPPLARRVVADFLARPERLQRTPEQLAELTAREREVMALVACGLSNEEIAERLVVTRATAKTHVSRALCKLGARDRAQLVVLAYEAGLVAPRLGLKACRSASSSAKTTSSFARGSRGS
jgi:DNA-binding NarL/FixJ family response regulator